MTLLVPSGMPVYDLLFRVDRALDDLAAQWLSTRGEEVPAAEEIERDRRTQQPVLSERERARLRRFQVARFALSSAANLEHHARGALESARRHGATYQELGAPVGLSRQLVQRRYGTTDADRAAAQTAITAAVATLAPYPSLPDARWSTTPLAHNFSVESELSAALVTLQGATASTPVHILLFHSGDYLGTGTDQPEAGVHLLGSASTNSVVTIEFHELGDPHAGPPVAIRTARFRWLDDRAQWFGDLPPDVTSSTARCGYIRYFATTSHIGDLFRCQPDYVHEAHSAGATLLRVERPDGAVEYVSGTRYDDTPLTWSAGSGTVVVDLGGKPLREYPAGTHIRHATVADLRAETDYPL